MKWQHIAPFFAAGCLHAATFTVQGNTLAAASANLQVTFTNADVTGITNVLTGEQYLRNPSSNSQTDLGMLQSTGQQLAPAGPWTVNAAGTSATLTMADSVRSITIAVSIDASTGQIVVNLDGKASHGGVQYLEWGSTGFDMNLGRLIVPGQGGIALTTASFSASSYNGFYGTYWEAPLSLFQTALGGVAFYSTDTNSLFRNIVMSANAQQTANQQIQTEAVAPWAQATEAGPIEWRIAAYTGEWQVGARIYRDWHNAKFPPNPATGARAWVNNIRTVVQVGGNSYDSSTLDAMASVLNPSQTLLYMVGWRSQTFDNDYPDYDWVPSAPNYIAHAHQLGFHVLLHANAMGVTPTNADFASVAQYQMRDPYTGQLTGWLWSSPPSTPNRFAGINPAAAAYRQLLITRLTPAIQNLQADAIHLDAGACVNDANGLIQGMNCWQGLEQLQKDLVAAFPSLVIGGENTNDSIAPYQDFSQPLIWAGNQSPDITPPVPIGAYVFGNNHRYVHLGALNPDSVGFIALIAPYEGQAVLPTLPTPLTAATQPDMARYLNAIHAFENYALTPAWDTPWNGARMVYKGSGGATASITDSGTLIQFSLQQGSSSSTLYQRVHAINQIDSPNSVPNWPAFNGTVTMGLDPALEYWLDSTPKNTSLPHITGLPAGAKIALGTGTLIAPQFSYFTIAPPASAAFDFFGSLWLANLGITYQGQDYPLGDGATLSSGTLTVGGATRPAIDAFPPWMTKSGGDVFVEYTVPLPAGSSTLNFAAGMDDSDIGRHQGTETFNVEINGAVFWERDLSTGAWQPGSIDLSAWSGQTVKIRLVENPGPGGPFAAFGGWSNLQLSNASASYFNPITISTPVATSNIAATGGVVGASNGSVNVSGLPFNGTIMLLNGGPSAVAAGQTLFNLPYTLSQSSNTSLAVIPNPPPANAGNVAPQSSGGVTKQQTLYAPAPTNGQTIFSWLLQVPAPVAFSFSAGFWDGKQTAYPQGYLMSVRVNGNVLWQRVVGLPPSWQSGAIDLSRWAGQTILLELITDSQGMNSGDFTSWGDLVFSATSGASCIVSLGSSNQITAPASGASGNIAVNAAQGCDWIAGSAAAWITATPSTANGSGSVAYTVAPNYGPARQATLDIGGYLISVSQAGAVPFSGPEITSAVTVAGGSQNVAPNTWVVIKGSNLSATTRAWLDSDFVNGQMPFQLDAVTASINGQPAIVEYIDAGQMNILTPMNIGQGAVPLTITSSGVTSAPVYLSAQPVFPEFFLYAGTQYIAARHPDESLMGPTTLYPGLTTPAKPGEVVALFASGFGQTNPPIANGAVSQYANLSPTPVVKIGGVVAEVQFAGVVSPGLYQFSVKVPDATPNGDNSVVITYQGLSTAPGAMIPVQR